MCDICLCVNIICLRVCGGWGWEYIVYCTCTGIYIVYMYAYLHNYYGCVYFYIMLSFSIHSRFTLCNLLFILLA